MTTFDVIRQAETLRAQAAALDAQAQGLIDARAAELGSFAPGDRVIWDHGQQTRIGVVDRIAGKVSGVRNPEIEPVYVVKQLRVSGDPGPVILFGRHRMRGLRAAIQPGRLSPP